MTWQQFKQHVEAQGVKDDDKLEYIDYCLILNLPKVERVTDLNRYEPVTDAVIIRD